MSTAHWWTNCEFVETDVDTGDGDALFTILALVCTKRVCPLDFIYADYGPDYARVRRARGYSITPLPGPIPPPLVATLADLEAAVRRAFSDRELTRLCAIGGVMDFAGTPGAAGDPI